MEDKKIVTSKMCVLIVLGVTISMILGSIFDYQLSQSIYDEQSLFGLIFAAYGQIPSAVALSIGGGLWIYTGIKYKGLTNSLRLVVGILLVLFGVFMGYYEPADYLVTLSKPLLLIISLLINAFSIFCVISLVKGHGEKEMRKLALFLVFFVISQMVVVNVIKIPWARPRMRLINIYPEIGFAPWWKIGSSVKDTYLSMGVGSNEFKSFPSGHTASSLNILFVCILARYSRFFTNHKKLIFGACILFGILTAFSRIVLGAHFLSDVTVGFAITFALYCVSVNLFYKNRM